MENRKLPIIFSSGMLPFPGNEIEISVSKPTTINSLHEAMNKYNNEILIMPQFMKDTINEITVIKNAVIARIMKVDKKNDDAGEEFYDIVLECKDAVEITSLESSKEILVNSQKNTKINSGDVINLDEIDTSTIFASFNKILNAPVNKSLFDQIFVDFENSLLKIFKGKKFKFKYWEKSLAEFQKLKERKVYIKDIFKFTYYLYLQTIYEVAQANTKKESFDFNELHNLWLELLINLWNNKIQIAAEDINNIIAAIFEVEQHDLSDKETKQIDDDINRKMNEAMGKQQKEFYLREKIKTIKEMLGDISNREDETEKIKKRLKNNPYPTRIKEKILAELNKYETAFSSNESGMVKSYIDWLLDLPWWQESEDNLDLNNVQKVLDTNHFGIQKVKDRIIEHIAMKANNKKAGGSIICLVGPPGVGKTSLARSIADALNKTYVKVALGGVKDEAEIRGHRRTYLGAMPGRIIKAMKKAKVINPLFLLDEIDKMSSDFKGDPASAMLEVLDPEQNKTFSDNYIEEEYDLSKVMFICTANYYNQIPVALIDRLEIIELSSYTANEKKQIAKNHLIGRVLEKANLTKEDINFNDEAIDFIINHYTREAGVRELERLLEQIIRKSLVAKLKGQEYDKLVTPEVVKKLLGKIRFDVTLKDKQNIPGIVNGMAYTAAGGDLLPIEATYFPGKGNIVITGNLEKTMNESVNVAFGYVKANAEKFGIKDIKFSEIDVHVHVPAGGIPKDGPSAGVTITTALISLFRNQSVPSNISMTGEIMLRGKVGIIGGVKEKVISAVRAGISNIFIPIDDERFLEDIPAEILEKTKINLVETYDDIFNKIFLAN